MIYPSGTTRQLTLLKEEKKRNAEQNVQNATVYVKINHCITDNTACRNEVWGKEQMTEKPSGWGRIEW